jgi:uncharacterized protein with GYD domain
MSTYIALIRYTQQGIEHIKEGPARLDAARKAFEKAGARLRDFYLLCGQYDALAIGEAPDDTTMAKLSLASAMGGNLRTETCRAFSEAEFRKLVAEL